MPSNPSLAPKWRGRPVLEWPNVLLDGHRDQAGNHDPDQPGTQGFRMPGTSVVALVSGLHGQFGQAHATDIEDQHLHHKHPVIQRFRRQDTGRQFRASVECRQDQH